MDNLCLSWLAAYLLSAGRQSGILLCPSSMLWCSCTKDSEQFQDTSRESVEESQSAAQNSSCVLVPHHEFMSIGRLIEHIQELFFIDSCLRTLIKRTSYESINT